MRQHERYKGISVSLRPLSHLDLPILTSWLTEYDFSGNLDFIYMPSSEPALSNWVCKEAEGPTFNDNQNWIIENESGTSVGFLRTYECDRANGLFHVAVAVPLSYRRKGYVSDAMRTLLRHYFFDISYYKAVAVIYSFNEPSIALFTHLGFTFQGRLTRTHYHKGAFYDQILMAIDADCFCDQGVLMGKHAVPSSP